MTDTIPLDSSWIAANPPPVHGIGTTKNSRGRVLAIGGSAMVPGALRLTGEAALRVGAGKLQMATIESAAIGLGLLVPEAGVLALPQDSDGEIDGAAGPLLEKSLNGCDTLIIGPGMGSTDAAKALLQLILMQPCDEVTMVVDALAIGSARDLRETLAAFDGRMVFTPHHGEMAMLTGIDEDAIAQSPEKIARDVAAQYGAVVVLKGSDTVIAALDGTTLHYGGGGTGLATGGSGDVLAGAIGGLLSRGAFPIIAAGWGVWLHGQSGRRVATTSGPIGFLGREVPAEFPRLLPQ
jgi:ADP-dependent NAD(P)H-hydrate dehydratase